MKILAISDVEEAILYEETKRAKIGPVDMVISCGDLKEPYLSYISTVYQAPLFYVRGNHDAKLIPNNPVGENLHGKLLNYRGIRMLGFEGSPFYSAHAVQYRETDIRLLALQAYIKSFFKGRPDIIVTHGPPQGIHDQPDFAHRGTAVYTQMIHSLKPRFFLHGHTHLSYRRNAPRLTRVGATTVINVYGYYLFEM